MGTFDKILHSLLIIFMMGMIGRPSLAIGQTKKAKLQNNVDDLNEYVQFANESIHGLYVIHRMLENYNQEINKYVDLPGYKLTNYSNKDLPKNIFEDPDNWFYKRSPLTILSKINSEENTLPERYKNTLHPIINSMNKISANLNQLRFDLESYIDNNDLKDTSLVKGIYPLLEEGVKYYDDFSTQCDALELALVNTYNDFVPAGAESDEWNYFFAVQNAHLQAKTILKALRTKNDAGFEDELTMMTLTLSDVRDRMVDYELVDSLGEKQDKILFNLQETVLRASTFFHVGLVPEEYKQYGKFYYYHNFEIVSKLNQYGNGYASELNDIIQKRSIPFLKFIEEPHFFKVIYPEKIDNVDHIVSSDDDIAAIPEKLKDREIIESNYSIDIDSMKFEIHLYDNKIPDGDIVSINYNGDWVLEHYSLEEKPITLKIKLNEKGKNYILMHAESIGRRPPNTMALSYKYKGERKEIFIQSDLNASEMIEINYVDPSR